MLKFLHWFCFVKLHLDFFWKIPSNNVIHGNFILNHPNCNPNLILPPSFFVYLALLNTFFLHFKIFCFLIKNLKKIIIKILPLILGFLSQDWSRFHQEWLKFYPNFPVLWIDRVLTCFQTNLPNTSKASGFYFLKKYLTPLSPFF